MGNSNEFRLFFYVIFIFILFFLEYVNIEHLIKFDSNVVKNSMKKHSVFNKNASDLISKNNNAYIKWISRSTNIRRKQKQDEFKKYIFPIYLIKENKKTFSFNVAYKFVLNFFIKKGKRRLHSTFSTLRPNGILFDALIINKNILYRYRGKKMMLKHGRILLEAKKKISEILKVSHVDGTNMVDAYELFTSSEKYDIKTTDKEHTVEIFIENSLNRVVVFCFKPSFPNDNFVGDPADAPIKYKTLSNKIMEIPTDSISFIYNQYTSWGSPNLLRYGAFELIISPYLYFGFKMYISCQNKKTQGIYKYESTVKVGLYRVIKDIKKIIGITNIPSDAKNFEFVISDEIDTYNLTNVLNNVAVIKVENITFDPPECPKIIYAEGDDTKPVHLPYLYPNFRIYNLDKGNIIYRMFYLKVIKPEKNSLGDGYLEEEPDPLNGNGAENIISFHCFFNHASKKKKVVLFKDKIIRDKVKITKDNIKKSFYIPNDKEKFLSPNYKVDFEICNFEYKKDYDSLICERSLNEFALFIYNCDKKIIPLKETPVPDPIYNLRKLGLTNTVDELSAIPLFTDDIKLYHITENFPNYHFFLTSYIDTGFIPLVANCTVKNPDNDGETQDAYIYLTMKADIKSQKVKLCDFTRGSQYAYMNSYEEGPSCIIEINKNSIFAFKCPPSTKKKPSNCFSQVYIEDKLFDLKDKANDKFIPYSESIEEIAVGSFNNYVSNSFNFECYCVDKDDENDKKFIIQLRYRNYDQVEDFSIYETIPYPSIHLGPFKTHFCDFSNTSILEPSKKTPLNYACTVFPKALDYIVLNCPTHVADDKTESLIGMYTSSKDSTLNLLGENLRKKRNIYEKIRYIPQNAPLFVIDKSNVTIVGIDEKIPGTMIRNVITMKFLHKNNYIRWDSTKETEDLDSVTENKELISGDNGDTEKTLDPKSLREFLEKKTSAILKDVEEKKSRIGEVKIKFLNKSDVLEKKYDLSKHVEADIDGINFFKTLNQKKIDEVYDKYIGLENRITNGLIVFQLPPYIRDNINLQLICKNAETVKENNLGNNGIMTISLRAEGHIIEGCYFYKGMNLQSYDVLTKNINIDSNENCNITAEGEVSHIGVICSTHENFSLDPQECLLEYYDSSNLLLRTDQMDSFFEHYSNGKGTVYLKIPPAFVKYLNINCTCQTIHSTPSAIKKKTINIKLNSSNKDVKKYKQISVTIQPDFPIGEVYDDKKKTLLTRKKYICDFTASGHELYPSEQNVVVNYCYLELEDNLNFVEIICPAKLKSKQKTKKIQKETLHNSPEGEAKGTNGEVAEEEETGGKEEKDEEKTEKDLIQNYEKIKYIPDNINDEIHNKTGKDKIENILPGIVVMNRSIPFSIKKKFFFMSPLLVKEGTIIKLYCDNSLSTYKENIGKKGIAFIRFHKNTIKENLEGCDFSDEKINASYYTKSYNLNEGNAVCEIPLKPNTIISLKCPDGNIIPSECFSKVHVKSNFDNVVEESIYNIFNKIKVIKNESLKDASVTFLLISEITGKELDFSCNCVHYKTNRTGKIIVKNERKSRYALIMKNQSIYKPINVAPTYIKDTYVCDFTESNYNITEDANANLLEIQKSYLENVASPTKNELNYIRLDMKKEDTYNEYIKYLKTRISHLTEESPNLEPLNASTVIYKCNVDLSSFDTLHIKCPSKEDANKLEKNTKMFYDSSVGSSEDDIIKKITSSFYGVLSNPKGKKQSFFEDGEVQFISSPYINSYQIIDFICIYSSSQMPKKIGVTSIFLKKNDHKILGCNFHHPSNLYNKETIYESDASEARKEKEEIKVVKDVFEFEVEMKEGEKIHCIVEASENDVIGFNCPDSFEISPASCFNEVRQIELDMEEKQVKMDTLIQGVKVLKGNIVSHSFTPTYIILPSKISNSLSFYCSCNSLKTIQTGIIQVNVIGDDVKKMFKKIITKKISTVKKNEYVIDFTSDIHSIRSQDVFAKKEEEENLDVSTKSINLMNIAQKKQDSDINTNIKKRKKSNFKHVKKNINSTHESQVSPDATVENTFDNYSSGNLEYIDDLKKTDDILLKSNTETLNQQETKEELIIDNLRTKQIFEFVLHISEFGKVKIICPLRDFLNHKQIKLLPENFFEYVYVKRNKSEQEREQDNKQKESSQSASDDNKTPDDTEEKKQKQAKTLTDEKGNEWNVYEETKQASFSIEEFETKTQDVPENIFIKHIHDVVSFVDYKNEIVDGKYVSTLYVSPLILSNADFFISCDNSLTINENTRGKIGIARIYITSNKLKINGSDFTGNYFYNFAKSEIWEELNKSIVHKITAGINQIIGIACPANSKLQPNDCFETVLQSDKPVKINNFFKTENIFLLKRKNKDILSFIKLGKYEHVTFSCKCYIDEKDSIIEAVMEVTYDPDVLSASDDSNGSDSLGEK